MYAEVKAAVIGGLGPVCFEARLQMIHWSQRLMNQDSERRHKEKKGTKLHLPFLVFVHKLKWWIRIVGRIQI